MPSYCRNDFSWMNVGTAPKEASAVARTLTTATTSGFFFLGSRPRWGSSVRCGRDAFVVENLYDFRQAQRDLDWSFGDAEIDFSTHLVFAYRLPEEYCQRYVEPLAIRLRADGRLEPQQPTTLPSTFCGYSGWYTTNLVAMARVSLPERGFSFQHLDGRVSFFALTHPIGRMAPAPESLERQNVSVSGQVVGVFSLPARGTAQAERLTDGRLIWLVHHEAGSVSALDARIDLSWGLRGLGLAARWDPAARRFNHILDEYGGAGVHEPDLKRLELEVDAVAGKVNVGGHATAAKRRVQQPLLQPAAESYGVNDYERRWTWLSLEEAMAAADGTTVLVNARVVLDPKRPASLCSAEREQSGPRCVRLSPDIRPQDGYAMTFRAPTFVVVRKGELTEPMVTDMRAGGW